jgi:hypothetical protein
MFCGAMMTARSPVLATVLISRAKFVVLRYS